MSYKSLLTRGREAFDLHRQDRQQAQPTRPPLESRSRSSVRWWLPTAGNVIFTLLVIGSLLWAQNIDAINLGAPNAAAISAGTIDGE